KEIYLDFKTDFNDFFVQNLSIKPQVGGQIKAKGILQPNLLKNSSKFDLVNWEKVPFQLNFETQLP
ncbi:MAG TPA: hypothetical protein DCF68_16860, partial [Cyanothece sp. UBA12306]|nr:hypothetical protein [Cyanothece sp. UBA12306]